MQLPSWIVDSARYVGSLLLLLLVAALMGIAAIPAWWLVTRVHADWGWVAAAFSLPFAYAIWGLGYSLLCLAYKRLTFYRAREGEFPFFTWQVLQWAITGRLTDVANIIFVRHLRGTPYIVWWFRLLGAKIGRRVTIMDPFISDWDLIEIGDDAMFGANASVIGHVGEMGKVKLARVVIGKHCNVGLSAAIFPGVTMGDGSVLGGFSLAPKGKTIPANQIWGGVPAEFIRERKGKDFVPPPE